MEAPRVRAITLLLLSPLLPGSHSYGQKPQNEAQGFTVTNVRSKSVTLTRQYVGKIHSCRHIVIRSLTPGNLTAIMVKDGQAVKKGDLIFRVTPTQDKDGPDAEKEDKFGSILSPFGGTIGRVQLPPGSPVKEGAALTTLSDNSEMWVDFNVPEKQYLEYMAEEAGDTPNLGAELVLANEKKFPQSGKVAAVAAEVDTKTGNVAFRANFPNPDRLLRHGQTGTVRINRVLDDAIVIPRQATLEVRDQRYVYVVDQQGVARRREIVVRNEVDDQYVVQDGVSVGEKIVLKGIKRVHDGDKVTSQETPGG